MTGSRRCNYCSIGWPDLELYHACPQCLEETRHSTLAPELTLQEAYKARRRCAFNWYLAQQWFEPAVS